VITGGTAIEVLRKCPLQDNGSVLVLGASGGVGSAVLQLLHARKKVSIFATAGSSESVEYLRANFGIPNDHIVSYSGVSQDELRQNLLKANGGKKFHIVIDLYGAGAKQLGFSLLDYDGTIVSIVAETDTSYVTPLYPIHSSNSLFDVNGTFYMVFFAAPLYSTPDKFPFFANILRNLAKEVESGVLKPLKTTVIGKLSLNTVKKAHELLEDHHTKGKMIMEIN